MPNAKPQRSSIWIMQQKLQKAQGVLTSVHREIINDEKRGKDSDWNEAVSCLSDAEICLDKVLSEMFRLRAWNAQLKEQAK